MLFIGEKVGTKDGQKLDIAVDPLEGANLVTKDLPNSYSMLAVEEEDLFCTRYLYGKNCYWINLPKNLVDLNNSIEKNISLLSDAKNSKPENLTGTYFR